VKFNIVDGIVLATVAFGMWRGFVTGIIRELSQVFGLFAAFALSIHFMRPFGVFLVQNVNIVEIPPEGGALVGFIVIFSVVFSAVYVLARLLERIADGLKLGVVNKMLGGIVGGFKTVLVLSIAFVFLGQMGLPSKTTQSRSYLYGSVESVAPEVWEVFTQSVPKATRLTRKVGERFWIRQGDAEDEATSGADSDGSSM
jgi:membrane protein required for colicin V production